MASDEHSNQVNSRNMLLVPGRMFIVVLKHDGPELSGNLSRYVPGLGFLNRGPTVRGPGKASRLERDFNASCSSIWLIR